MDYSFRPGGPRIGRRAWSRAVRGRMPPARRPAAAPSSSAPVALASQPSARAQGPPGHSLIRWMTRCRNPRGTRSREGTGAVTHRFADCFPPVCGCWGARGGHTLPNSRQRKKGPGAMALGSPLGDCRPRGPWRTRGRRRAQRPSGINHPTPESNGETRGRGRRDAVERVTGPAVSRKAYDRFS